MTSSSTCTLLVALCATAFWGCGGTTSAHPGTTTTNTTSGASSGGTTGIHVSGAGGAGGNNTTTGGANTTTSGGGSTTLGQVSTGGTTLGQVSGTNTNGTSGPTTTGTNTTGTNTTGTNTTGTNTNGTNTTGGVGFGSTTTGGTSSGGAGSADQCTSCQQDSDCGTGLCLTDDGVNGYCSGGPCSGSCVSPNDTCEDIGDGNGGSVGSFCVENTDCGYANTTNGGTTTGATTNGGTTSGGTATTGGTTSGGAGSADQCTSCQQNSDCGTGLCLTDDGVNGYCSGGPCSGTCASANDSCQDIGDGNGGSVGSFCVENTDCGYASGTTSGGTTSGGTTSGGTTSSGTTGSGGSAECGTCSSDADCAQGVCLTDGTNDFCSGASCQSDGDCTGGDSCTQIGDGNGGTVGYCLPADLCGASTGGGTTSGGTTGGGSAAECGGCSSDADCAQGACLTDGTNDFCSGASCQSDGDCSGGDSCTQIDDGNGGSVGYCLPADLCGAGGSGGSTGGGSTGGECGSCSSDADCGPGYCLTDGTNNFCSGAECQSDGDCTGGDSCDQIDDGNGGTIGLCLPASQCG